MQLAIVLVLSIGGGAVYFVAALACGIIAAQRSEDKCYSCSTYGSCSDSELHGMFGIIAGILWPLYILGRISAYIAHYDEIQTEKKDRRHQEKLTQLRQDAEIAEAKKQAAHDAVVNDRKRQLEDEATMQDLILEQTGTPAAERILERS